VDTKRIILTAVVLVIGLIVSLSALSQDEDFDDVTELGLEDLMNIEVTSVAKKAQKLSQTSAAVYVITSDDIRRSGLTTVPEVLRLAPGVNVAQINGNSWAISIRGFNTLYSNKLQVLVDGRSVYSPLFSGVHWDSLDLVLADIERIEVIRGPGASLWGANAVNGVINILTKHSDKTKGSYMSALAGNHEKGNVSLRYGGELTEKGTFRVYGKYFDRNEFEFENGENGNDDWRARRTGFRVDWNQTLRDSVMAVGNIYDGESGFTHSIPTLTAPYSTQGTDELDASGGDFLAKWTHEFSEVSNMSLQFYYEKLDRVDQLFEENLDIYDIELQHRFPLATRHDIIWGLQYRNMEDTTKGSFPFSLSPLDNSNSMQSAFIQDNIAFFDDTVSVTLGAKVERYDDTGTEIQPNIRANWQVNDKNSLWGAVSKSARTPSRVDRNSRINFQTFPAGINPGVVSIFGSSDVKSEELIAYEIGYRSQMSSSLAFDVTGFFNKYDNISDTSTGAPYFENEPFPSHMVFPQTMNNGAEAEAYGVEAFINFQANDIWRLTASTSLLDLDIESDNVFTKESEKNNPQTQHQLRSYLDLGRRVELDSAIYYVSGLSSQDISNYTRVDFHFSWQARQYLEVFAGLQNAFDSGHSEFGSIPFTISTEIPRTYHIGITMEL